MKKRNFCEEQKRIIYTVGKTTHCKLDCRIDLFPDKESVVLPYDMHKKLERKYKGLTYDFSDCYIIHIEAQATCQEGDTFDEKKGRTIAYSKAQAKLYRLLRRLFFDAEVYLLDATTETQETRHMFTRYFMRECKFLSTL